MVDPFPVTTPVAWPWTNQSAENSEAAERDDQYGENRQTVTWDHAVTENYVQYKKSDVKEPNKPDDDVSDSDSAPLPQAQVDDWMNDSQVTIQAGEDVEENLSVRRGRKKPQTNTQRPRHLKEGAAAEETTPGDTDHLHGNHVVGEDVRMTRGRCPGGRALILPSFETQTEDEDAEGEEDKEVGDGEGGEDDKDKAVSETGRRNGGVRGGEQEREKQGGIGGGVEGHDCFSEDVTRRYRDDGRKSGLDLMKKSKDASLSDQQKYNLLNKALM